MVKYTKIYSGGLPELKEDDIFRTYIPLNTTQETTRETTQEIKNNKLNNSQILNIILENPNITRKEIAEKMYITEDGVKYNIDILRKIGVLKREGATKKGIWKIKNK